MSWKTFVKFLLITVNLNFCYTLKFLKRDHDQLLIDFTCAAAKDELEKHPEMRTIAMVELENNFPPEFSGEVLKCLPADVAKVIINPHERMNEKSLLYLTKQTLVIYLADVIKRNDIFVDSKSEEWFKFSVVHHLSKRLIVSDRIKIKASKQIFEEIPNVVQIFEKDGQVIARSFDMTRNLTTFEIFESSQQENLSQILFPDNTKNLKGQKLFAVWNYGQDAKPYKGGNKPNNKWTPYLDIIAEKLNATLDFYQVYPSVESLQAYRVSKMMLIKQLSKARKLDFYLNSELGIKLELESYNSQDWCFIAPLPQKFSITELILFLPMDKSCWMWLGITIAVSTLIWRISEGHWNFAFGAFSYFMGQAQLSVRIKTNRLTMKILLQLLIFAIFIFSNGYQSLVTSFMLDPVKKPILKTIHELFKSDLKIGDNVQFALNQLFKDNPSFHNANENGRVVNDVNFVTESWLKEMKEINLAKVQKCKINKARIEYDGDGKSWEGIYVIDDVVFGGPDDIYVRPGHFYIENFQELMDRSFEAGLHQAWERFFWEKLLEDGEKEEIEEKNEVLNFELIAPSLYILVFGLPAALLALFCEIFWKDFVSELTRGYFKRKWREILTKIRRVPKKRIRVKREQRRRRHSI